MKKIFKICLTMFICAIFVFPGLNVNARQNTVLRAEPIEHDIKKINTGLGWAQYQVTGKIVAYNLEGKDPRTLSYSYKIRVSQLKFLYPLKTLVFPAFSPPRFGPFPSFFPLREEMRETFFRPSLQPYPVALRKFAWPLWWRGRKCSSWYLHQNVPAAPAHPWVLPREREGWSYMYASTDGSENHPYPRSSFGSIGTHC